MKATNMTGMKRVRVMMIATLAAIAVGCVTINVYFPAAAAEKAAQQFIGNVIGPAESPRTTPAPASSSPPVAEPAGTGGGLATAIMDLLVPAAHAGEQQPDIKISTPAIQKLRAQMRARFRNGLETLLDSGAVGFTNDGLVALRDPGSVPLSKRSRVHQLIDAENKNRITVYKQIAVANGHPEWTDRIRETFAAEWRQMAHQGWYYQDAAGNWVQK